MTVYTPASLILAADEPERRLFSQKIREDEVHQYDRKTFLFDAVKVDGRDDINLYSPPLLNFKKDPGLPEIECTGKKLRYHIRTTAMRRFSEWTIESEGMNLSENPVLNFRFNRIPDRSLHINQVVPFPEDSRVLTAIQKNNEIRWIKDWFQHYRKHFGVEYLVLYDNGSNNFEELRENLPENTILVKWQFPYGPTFSHDNKFAQLGALNHCRRVFGCRSVIFNFDIDELLVLNTDSISDVLHEKRVIYFSSFNVPNRKNLPEDFSFSSYKERQIQPRYYARKFIFRASSSTGVMPHYVQTQQIIPFAYFILFLRKARNMIIMRTGKHKSIHVRCLSAIIRLLTNNRKEPSLSVDTAYFLHFLGISTHWKDLGYRINGDSQAETEKDPFLMSITGDSA